MEMQKEKFLVGAKKNRINQAKQRRSSDLNGKICLNTASISPIVLLMRSLLIKPLFEAHYPIEFMAALLTSEVQNADKILKYIADAERWD